MDHNVNISAERRRFTVALKRPPERRTPQDLQVIFSFLHGLEALSPLREPALSSICKTLRYEYHAANDILYYRGELSTCWYILLSGSVFIDGSMYLPHKCFGKRTAGCTRRPNECLILEPSEMIVVDYPDVQLMRTQRTSHTKQLDPVPPRITSHSRTLSEGSEQLPEELQHVQSVLQRSEQTFMCRGEYTKRTSHASDTSSAYSGSDMMQSSSIEDQDVDLSGMRESLVDSDDEEVYIDGSDVLHVRDAVRECLEKDPQDRTDDDIETLLEFMQRFPAFANMTLATRRALCAVMVFAVVEKAGTVVMKDGEELDSWSVILNGHVQIQNSDGSVRHLQMGDSFGITPTIEKLYHKGMMTTTVDDCQFVCIAQQEYYGILHQGEENTLRIAEDGQVVMVLEHREHDNGNRRGHIVIRGTPDKLTRHLVEEHSAVDPTYMEDFLLTYRAFLQTPLDVANKLLQWFNDPDIRDRVTRVVLLWVNNHFNDFESEPLMSEFLEKFEHLLEKERMIGQLRLLNIACAAKARARNVVLTRATRDEILHFSVLGGLERGCGIFITKVEKSSKANEAGLRRGDQILEVNNHNFEHISHNRALEILRGSTHLSITVKSNLLGYRNFREMLSASDSSPSRRGRRRPNIPERRQRLSTPELDEAVQPVIQQHKDKKSDKKEKGFLSSGSRTKIHKALQKFNFKPKSANSESELNHLDDSAVSQNSSSRKSSLSSTTSSPLHAVLHLSASNPDLTASSQYDYETKPDYPEHVIKVYRSDQTCKYLLIHRETTAREVVMLSLREFGISDPSSHYSLCEVTVEAEGLTKQKRLPDQLANLPDRMNLNGRYYLRNNHNTDPLVPDEMMDELVKESKINFLQLNADEVAAQLTLLDFGLFRDVEPTEYVDDLFDLKSKYGTPHLTKFTELVNKEMFWVVTEVCSEPNIIKRGKMIKQFIKIARHCKECKNFNSMFAVLSGLGHGSVSRLKATWDRVPSKHIKMFEDLQNLMDPSRNMSKYRNLVNSEHVQPPMIPWFPVMKKDLTFIHLGNDSKVESLVNFEKLRMVAKEVRHTCNMCSAQYDVNSMILDGRSESIFSAFGGTNTSAVATMRRRKRSSTLPNPKKMFEEAQMVRRVRAYLSNMKAQDDEDKLNEMSLQCEPPPGSGIRKRDPSPSPAASLNNNKPTHYGPKFGQDSPEAVQKMMALSDKTRPHHSKYPMANMRSPNVRRHRPASPQPRRSHFAPPSVPLTSESSSVCSLNKLATRKGHNSSSVCSSESGSPTNSVGSAQQQLDTDSGHNSITSSNFDTHSTSSVGSANSPPSQKRASLQSNAAGSLHSAPPPCAPQRPPLPPYHVAVQSTPGYSHYVKNQSKMAAAASHSHSRRPALPDYQSATKMSQYARRRDYSGHGRSRSHDGMPRYYCDNGLDQNELLVDEDFDDEDVQVSAV